MQTVIELIETILNYAVFLSSENNFFSFLDLHFLVLAVSVSVEIIGSIVPFDRLYIKFKENPID